jgi:hypothetical protein
LCVLEMALQVCACCELIDPPRVDDADVEMWEIEDARHDKLDPGRQSKLWMTPLLICSKVSLSHLSGAGRLVASYQASRGARRGKSMSARISTMSSRRLWMRPGSSRARSILSTDHALA